MRQKRPAGRAELAPAAADDLDRHRGRSQRAATAAESRGGGMESYDGANSKARPRQRGDADLSVLASATVYGEESCGGSAKPPGLKPKIILTRPNAALKGCSSTAAPASRPTS